MPDIPVELGGGTNSTRLPPPLSEAQESSNLWSTLRRIFLSMDRTDLAQQAHIGADLNQFRKEFEF